MTPFVIVRSVFLGTMVCLYLLDNFIDLHWGWYIITVVAFLSFLVAGSAVMKYNIFLRAYTKPCQAENKISITFDDGPNLFTESVLDVLSKYRAKASFFVIGKHVENRPDLARRIVAEGHDIGNHSYTHHKMFSLFRKNRIVSEIERTNQVIKNITGKAINYFRPPYGVTNPAIAAAVRSTGVNVIGWNIRSYDTVIAQPEKVIERVVSKIKPGAVILLHDNREQTAKILEAILLYAKEKDYKCVTIGEMFKLN